MYVHIFICYCREGHSDIVSLLLDNKSTCWDTKSNNGRTPLHTVGLFVSMYVCMYVRMYVCMYAHMTLQYNVCVHM